MWQAVNLAVCSWGRTLTLHYYYTCAGLMLWLRVEWRSTCNDCGCTLGFWMFTWGKQSIFWVKDVWCIRADRLWLLKITTQFCAWHWLMMMHHHIKSSYERRRYFLDKAWTDGQSHRQIHGHCEPNVIPTPPQFSYGKQSRSTTLLLG